ncbi:MAG: LptF/LptG family permease [Bacteroidia bacterium]|nr:LptF/LptG family permease [Bacteroidia bacterium]
MPILDRYIIRQFLATFFFILGIVLAIAVLVDFVEKVDEFIDKKPPLREILFDYYVNFVPYYGNLLAPVCIFLAVILFTSRMAGRTELVPLLAAGVNFYRILRPYLVTALLLGGMIFVLKSYVIPRSTAARLEFEYKYLKKRRISSTYNIHKKVASDTFVYIQNYSEKNRDGQNFTMTRIVDGDIVFKLDARRMVWKDSTQSWELVKVIIRDIQGGRERLRMRGNLDTTFLLTPDDIFIKEQKAETMTLPELREYIRLEEMRGSDILEDLYIERIRRYSDPTAVIVLTLIGFAMSSRKNRGGVALQIGIGLLLCFLYIVLLFAGQAVISDEFPPWLAVWMPNFIFLPVAGLLLRLAPK